MFKQGMTTKGNCNCRIERSRLHVSCNFVWKALETWNGTYETKPTWRKWQKKGIALKASSSIQEESDKEDLNEIEEDDDFSLFIKRFNKFLRNKGNQRRTNFNPKKKGENSSSVPKCYECN